MTLKVIGAGFGRTGTDSMRHALNILGVGPTLHMYELADGTPLRQRWFDLVQGGTPDWDALTEGYNSCVDWPAAHYWRELSAAYPDAKVLLTMRSAESWWTSYEATILKYIRLADPESISYPLLAKTVFDGRPGDRDHAIEVYNRNVADVIATIAPERLLIHNLGDGWPPLCDWLGLPVPDQPYPSGNNAQDFVARATDLNPASQGA